jgi:NAD+ diphosphatase
MIQDIYPHKLLNPYLPEKKASPDSFVLSFNRDSVFTDGISLPRFRDLEDVSQDDVIYLFSIDGEVDYFLYGYASDVSLELPGFSYMKVRDVRSSGKADRITMFAIFTSLHLYHWYSSNRFCGRCGKRTSLDSRERALRCECGNLIYPRLVPAVIVGVTNGDKLLVTKYNRPNATNYALVAGFTEIGETLEETVEREVMEETGLKVKNIRYYKSQPWGIVDDLLAGFYCEVDGSDEITMDSSELKVAEWRSKKDIILQSDDYSLTGEMMRVFKES